MRLNSSHTALANRGLHSSAPRTRVNPGNPIGSMGNIQNEIFNGVLGGLDYDPEAVRGDLFKAAYLISDSFTKFSNLCAITTENKKANKKTHDLARPGQIAAA